MPEIKNNFLQGKMNKDLDSRILPSGQYRDAQNVLVTKSDNSDVGVLQNILGNKIPYPDSVDIISTYSKAKVIGCYADNTNEKIYYFVTDRATGILQDRIGPPGSSGNPLDTSNFHAIYVWDQTDSSSSPKKIVNGSFLNFSKDYLITGINLIDDLLFWTDNLNQPRRINVIKAANNTSFYNNEQKISVAKFAPFYPIRVLDSSNDSTMSKDTDITSEFLEEAFVRFSYRFKYEDGEYSTMAPFSQACFIPKLYDDTTGFTADQITTIIKNFDVKDMINYINKLIFSIQLPSTDSTVLQDLQIEKIQIICRIDGDLSIKVVDDVDANTASITNGIYNYTYKSTEPFKVLPEDQTIRVFDDIPVRAKSQEITSNRIIYGNYTNQKEITNSLVDFDTNYAAKGSSLTNNDDNLYKEYPYHSVKSRRKYQVGIVLADKFGRQSPVLLPAPTSSKTSIERSSITVPARNPRTFSSKYWSDYSVASDGVGVDTSGFNTTKWGDALTVRFNQPIQNAYSSSNPYGWYSYRVVVKQADQEYYNVYTSGIYRDATNIAYINLNSDNINKVPKDVTDINSQSEIAGSEVNLYSKVINTNTLSASTNAGILSDDKIFDVLAIATANSFGFDNTELAVQQNFVDEDQGLLLAKIPGDQTLFTSISSPSKQGKIAIFETEPFDSKINIFYETSSAGLISNLNTNISASMTGITSMDLTLLQNGTVIGLSEASELNSFVASVSASNNSGVQNATITIDSITNSIGESVFNDFELVQDNQIFKIKILNTFYYGESGEIFTFNFKSNFADEDFYESFDIELQNANPTIDLVINPISVPYTTTIGTIIGLVKGTNGSVKENFTLIGLSFELVSQTLNGGKYAVAENGLISTVTTLTDGQFDELVIKVIDSDGVTSVQDILMINTTSNSYSPFYRSKNGYSTAALASDQPTNTVMYHDGLDTVPALNDYVYTYYPNQGLYTAFSTTDSSSGNNLYYTMNEAVGTSNESFRTDSTGKVIEIAINE